jgi:hypothetical protein
MNLSKSLLAVPVFSFLVAAAAASGACSSSVTISIPPGAVVAYTGSEAVPDGIDFGTTSCSGDIYFVLGDGWGFCDDGVWDYTTEDPTGFGDYTLDSSISTGSNTGSNTSGSNTGSNTSGSSTGSNTGSNASGSDTSGSATTAGSSTSGGSDTSGQG